MMDSVKTYLNYYEEHTVPPYDNMVPYMKCLYYLYYGNQPSAEELSRQELEERIHDLENKMQEFGNSKNEVKPEDEKNK